MNIDPDRLLEIGVSPAHHVATLIAKVEDDLLKDILKDYVSYREEFCTTTGQQIKTILINGRPVGEIVYGCDKSINNIDASSKFIIRAKRFDKDYTVADKVIDL